MKIKIKYFDKVEVRDIAQGDWIDLAVPNRVSLHGPRYKLIPLGVAMELPAGYEAYIVPRSSTFSKFGIIMTNGMAVIDESYCGDDDQWFFPAYILEYRVGFIPAGARICQFRIQKKQPKIEFEVVETLGNQNRGGIGSTGI